ncbi:UNVERIFIED_CONTAM: hypothetical protein N8J90_13720 [Halobacillus marinus]
MKVEWSRSVLYLVIVCCLLTSAVLVTGYRLLVSPAKTEAKAAATLLAEETAVLDAMKSKKEKLESESLRSSRTIQQQLPVIPLIDQLLLELEKAEAASGSMITKLETLEKGEEEPGEEEEGVETDVEEEAVSLEPEDQSDNTSVKAIEGLRTLRFSVDVTSLSYPDMMDFLESLREAKRVIQIEAIKYERPDPGGPLSYSMVIESYYQPLYEELVNEAPRYQYEARSGKSVPFSIEHGEEGEAAMEEIELLDETGEAQ